MPTTDRQLRKFVAFAAGINNVKAEHELGDDELRAARNVDLDMQSKLRSRKGRTLVYTPSGNAHSLWNGAGITLFMDDGNLYRLSDVYELSLVRSGLSKDLPLSYDHVGGNIYYSNGLTTGKVTASGEAAYWGMECPISQPSLSLLGSGGMDAGDYQVAVTFVSQSGEESGAIQAAKITLAAVGGIQLSNIPQPVRSDISMIKIYISAANGTSLYARAQVAAGTTSYSLNSIVKEGKRLETQFLSETPPGHIVRHFRGSLYVASGDTLFFTTPWRYGLYDPLKNRFRFPERIRIVEPVTEGIFIGADRLYFLAGRTPDSMEQRFVDDQACLEGSGIKVPSTAFGEEGGGSVEFYSAWFSDKGWVVGMPDGTIRMLMEGRVAVPEYERGAGLYREEEGVKQLLGAMRGGGAADKLGAHDEITGTIIRNGIVIE